jgi:predicted metal-dependent peptidase
MEQGNMTEEFNLNRYMARLLLKEPFFAALSRTIDKFPSKGIPTAGVRINPNTAQFELIYNPDFFASLEDHCRLGVLKHEFYHLIFEHVTGRLPVEGMTPKWNICTDLAINTHLRGQLPENCLMPGQEGRPWEDMPHGKSAEWYMENLKLPESKKGRGDGGSGDCDDSDAGGGEDSSDGQGQEGVGTHDGWSEASEEAKQIAKERLKNNLEKAVKEASSKGWGTVSSDCRHEIMERLKTHVDWRKVLRYFIKTSQRSDRRSSMRVISRRYPYIHPGRKVNRQANIAISIDQSGSVSDSMLNAFFNELNKLSDLAHFTVIPFDTKVAEDMVYTWKKGESRKWERVMCGGTCFEAPTAYVNERKFDGHIVLTDLMAPKPKASKCQRMWMTTRYYAERPYFQTNERIIAIDCEE